MTTHARSETTRLSLIALYTLQLELLAFLSGPVAVQAGCHASSGGLREASSRLRAL